MLANYRGEKRLSQQSRSNKSCVNKSRVNAKKVVRNKSMLKNRFCFLFLKNGCIFAHPP